MNIPTHIVIDTKDGWVFSRDSQGHGFTEGTATHFAATRNSELAPEHRTYVVATVTPVMSPELMAAVLRGGDLPEIEPAGKVCISCGEPMGQPHKQTCVVYTGSLRNNLG